MPDDKKPVDLSALAVDPPKPREGAVVPVDDMVAAPWTAPHAWQSESPISAFAEFTRFAPVQDSPDLERVLNLPRRPRVAPGTPRAAALVERVTARYALARDTPCRCREIAVERGAWRSRASCDSTTSRRGCSTRSRCTAG